MSDIYTQNWVDKSGFVRCINKLAVSQKNFETMDIIEKLANESFDKNVEYGYNNFKEVIQKTKSDTLELNSKFDRIKFINIHLDRINKKYEDHLPSCTNPESCRINFDYESIAYFLRQELSELGVPVNEDTFTKDEKSGAEELLSKVIKDIEELKVGHQIIYDDLLSEIDDLKQLYFLGKKKWYQMLAGKFVDMAVSGIVSESVSKQIIESIKPNFTKLIG